MSTKRKLLLPPGLLIVFMIFLHACMTFRMSSKEVEKFFADKNVPATQREYQYGFRNIHYVEAGDTTGPAVLFVHGSPGSLSAFIDFLADVIHGKKDTLVPYENVDFARKAFVNAPVQYIIVDDMNHFVPWNHPELIRKAILKQLHLIDPAHAEK